MNRFVLSWVCRWLNTFAAQWKHTCCIRYITCKPSVLLCTLCIILCIRMICTHQPPPQKSKRTKNKLKYYLQTGDSHCQTQDPHTHHTKPITLVSLTLPLDQLVKASTALKVIPLKVLLYVLTSLHIVIHL